MNDTIYKALRGVYNIVMLTKKDNKESFLSKIKSIKNRKRIIVKDITNEISQEQKIKNKV